MQTFLQQCHFGIVLIIINDNYVTFPFCNCCSVALVLSGVTNPTHSFFTAVCYWLSLIAQI